VTKNDRKLKNTTSQQNTSGLLPQNIFERLLVPLVGFVGKKPMVRIWNGPSYYSIETKPM
jgi:hypothetical protein